MEQQKKQPFPLSIATYNIRNTTDRYNERKELLKNTIQLTDADIFGLQEVAFGVGGQLDYLIQKQDEQYYQQYNTEIQLPFQKLIKNDKDFRIDGNSIIIKKKLLQQNELEVLEKKFAHLSVFRNITLLKLKVQNSKLVWIANTHLHHIIQDHEIRLDQIKQIYYWLMISIEDFEKSNIVICGDFNAQPDSSTYKFLIDNGFKSVYQVVNGQEPEITFPTGLQAPTMDTDPKGTFDYIWIKGNDIDPQSAEIFGNKCKENDPTIYPSDHYGIKGHFKINL